MYLPTKYVPSLLGNQGYTVHKTWARLLPQLQQDNMLQAAAPKIAWLRATLHSTMNNGPPATKIMLTAPF